VHYLDKTEDPDKRQTILMSLKYNSAPFALKEIRNILKNPLSSETEEVLKSLFSKPRPKLLPAILDIANDPGSYIGPRRSSPSARTRTGGWRSGSSPSGRPVAADPFERGEVARADRQQGAYGEIHRARAGPGQYGVGID
jgi:hypothetical protein